MIRMRLIGRPLGHILMALCILFAMSCGSSESSPSPSEVPPTTSVQVATATFVATPAPSSEPLASPSAVIATPTLVPATPLAVRITSVPESSEQDQAATLLAGESGVYGFVVLDADGSVVASLNGTTPFITASTYKLILMADIYRRIELGERDVDEMLVLDEAMFDEDGDMYFSFDDLGHAFPLHEYLYAVGAYSSNASARTLLTLTDPDALRRTAESIGMEHTYLFADLLKLPFWPPILGVDASLDDLETSQSYLEQSFLDGGLINVTTPLDMARYQLALLNGTLISPWVSAQIAEILEDQLIRDRIPFYLPAETRVLNKPGNLEDAVNDVGVIYLPEGDRAIAILCQAAPDTRRATLIEQRLALIATGSDEIPPLPSDEEIEEVVVDDAGE